MELLLLLVAALCLMAFLNWLNKGPEDNREPYIRNANGQALALYVAGPANDLPQHESFIHDGSAHQNPAVYNYIKTRWFLIFPYGVEWEERYYPFTNNGLGIDFVTIQKRIDNTRLRGGQEVEVRGMPNGAERQAIRRENGEQLQRGVNAGDLQYNLRGGERRGFFGNLWVLIQVAFWICVAIVVITMLLGILTMAGGPL